MPHGKPAGVRCVQLAADHSCLIFASPERPLFCSGLQPAAEMCGSNRADALAWLRVLELETSPRP